LKFGSDTVLDHPEAQVFLSSAEFDLEIKSLAAKQLILNLVGTQIVVKHIIFSKELDGLVK
jgi:hypothetical protein